MAVARARRLIGGGPTFLGAMVGYNVTSEPLELAFYALAGGAILYVIGEIWHGMRRYGHRELGLPCSRAASPPASSRTSSSPTAAAEPESPAPGDDARCARGAPSGG